MESLCLPNDGNLDTDLALTSFIGNTEDAHPRLSSTQAFAEALSRWRYTISNLQYKA